jgi:hypothetical protein
MKWVKTNSLVLSYALIIVLSVFTSSYVKWGGDRWHGIIGHDANGYYAYLPAIFIYQDLNFSFYDHEIKEIRKEIPPTNYDYRKSFKGKNVNKYYIGTSIAQIPFFLTAHTMVYILGFERSGFSQIYYVFISLAAIFYAFIGIFYLNNILILYKISLLNRSLSLLALYFGTHLFYYTIFEPGMSHVYSFAFISMLLYYGMKYFKEHQLQTAVYFSVLLGIITLIRPVNLIVILILPFIAGSYKDLIKGLSFLIKEKPSRFLIVFIVFFAVVSIQLVVYKIQTGYYFVYSYAEEGFNFLDPHMFDILFSYQKGLFLYTPLCLISAFGIYLLYKKSKFEAFGLIVFFLLLTYVLSSWWMWFYGGSFSSRVYVEYLSLFGILLALIFQQLYKTKIYWVFFISIFLLVLFNQKQTYLYRVAYIHWSEMNKERYIESIYHPFQLWIKRALYSTDKTEKE